MSQPPAAPRVCPGCGATNRITVTFCHECGDPRTGAGQTGARRAWSPGAAPVRARHWEIWLALALITGVLGYSLFDWWHSEVQARQYRAGDTAVSTRHWDEAVAAFGALGDYRDASRRKTDAAFQMQARDKAYQTGLRAAEQHNIIAAYRAFSETLAIQPDYRDAPARFATAQQDVLHDALVGTIYRRVSGDTPGLYLYQAEGGDLLLPGSDARSLIRSFGLDDAPLVYDGPIPGIPPPALSPVPDSDTYNLSQLDADRRLLLIDPATLQVGGPVTPKVLPPALGAYGALLANRHLLWNPAGAASPPRFSLGYVQGYFVNKAHIYNLDTGQLSDLSQPGDTGYVLFESGSPAEQDRWLLGRYSSALLPPYQTTLYLLGDASGQPQPLTEVNGIVYEARLSPDSRFALYTSSAAAPNRTGGTLDLVLIDLLDPSHPTWTLATVPLDSTDTAASLQARFVPGGGTPQVLIRRVVGGDYAASPVQIDLWEGASTQHLWQGELGSLIAGMGYTEEIYWLAPDGKSLTITVPNRDGTAHLLWLALDGSRPAREVPLPTGIIEVWWPIFPSAAESGKYQIYYSVARQNSRTARTDMLVYGVPAQDPVPPPVLLTTLTAGVDYSTELLPLPAGLYAVKSANDTFQVRTLDNSLALPALTGIDLILPQTRLRFQPTRFAP